MLTANAYFGGWGIKEALDQGADIVICPRVTDAALVIGPAAWKFNWRRNDYDALAGSLAAGHIIECGAQCCGGNYAFFEEVPSFRGVGYPIAEIEADGSFTITKHPGTGGPGFRRHGHGPDSLRDFHPRLPQPGRHRPLRHHEHRTGRGRPCARHRLPGQQPAADSQGVLQHPRPLQAVLRGTADWPGYREKGGDPHRPDIPQPRRQGTVRRCRHTTCPEPTRKTPTSNEEAHAILRITVTTRRPEEGRTLVQRQGHRAWACRHSRQRRPRPHADSTAPRPSSTGPPWSTAAS